MKPLLKLVMNLALASVRRSPWLLLTITLPWSIGLLVWWFVFGAMRPDERWVGNALQWVALNTMMVAALGNGILGETLLGLRRTSAFVLAPQAARVLRVFLWLAWLVVGLAFGLPLLLLGGLPVLELSLPAVIAALTAALATSLLQLSTGSARVGRAAFQAVVLISVLVQALGRSNSAPLSTWVNQHGLFPAVFCAFLALLALLVWWSTVERVVHRITQPPVAIPVVPSDTVASKPSRAGTRARALAVFFAPQSPSLWESIGTAASMGVTFFVMMRLMAPRAPSAIYLVAGLSLFASSSFLLQSSWFSPRLLLLPRGFSRKRLSWQIYGSLLRAHLAPSLLLLVVTSTALGAAWRLPWSDVAISALVSLPAILLPSALMLLLRLWTSGPAVHSWGTALAVLLAFGWATVLIQLAMPIWYARVLNPAGEMPLSLFFIFLLGLLPLLAALIALEKACTAYDWVRMPKPPSEREPLWLLRRSSEP